MKKITKIGLAAMGVAVGAIITKEATNIAINHQNEKLKLNIENLERTKELDEDLSRINKKINRIRTLNRVSKAVGGISIVTTVAISVLLNGEAEIAEKQEEERKMNEIHEKLDMFNERLDGMCGEDEGVNAVEMDIEEI